VAISMVCVFKTKQIVVFLAVTRAEKKTRNMFPRCGVKAKYIFIENVFGSKDQVERRKP
jgi:hypothetical protein